MQFYCMATPINHTHYQYYATLRFVIAMKRFSIDSCVRGYHVCSGIEETIVLVNGCLVNGKTEMVPILSLSHLVVNARRMREGYCS